MFMEKRKCKKHRLWETVPFWEKTGCWSFGGGIYWGSQDKRPLTNVVHESVNLGI